MLFDILAYGLGCFYEWNIWISKDEITHLLSALIDWDMDKEEAIQTIVNVLFENTTAKQLPLEKCYELAEKIVDKFRPK